MSRHSREQSLPLATDGYVLGTREVFIQRTVLSDGTVTPAHLSLADIKQVAFSIKYGIIRMNIKSVGGRVSLTRSSGVSLQPIQKSIRMGVASSAHSLTLSKN